MGFEAAVANAVEEFNEVEVEVVPAEAKEYALAANEAGMRVGPAINVDTLASAENERCMIGITGVSQGFAACVLLYI